MVSGQLEHWGEAGSGRWISVYANQEHVFMVVAGLRFDTRHSRPASPVPAGTAGGWCRTDSPPGTRAISRPEDRVSFTAAGNSETFRCLGSGRKEFQEFRHLLRVCF